ncbi:hypothetical protein ACFVKC_40675, partial [Streptomyces noursei]|uniref:hypothetical protein n=1 Tax=Streptomyces noursei TaxID=1971 RepID=UPI003642650A
MKIEEVCDYLRTNGYTEKTFLRNSTFLNSEGRRDKKEVNILPFNQIFISQNQNEVYIVEEKESLFTPAELEKFDNLILTFIQFLSNKDVIKYNINLLLVCPFNTRKN